MPSDVYTDTYTLTYGGNGTVPDPQATETLIWTAPTDDPTAYPVSLRLYNADPASGGQLLREVPWSLVNGQYAATFLSLTPGTYWQRLGFMGRFGADSSDGPVTLPLTYSDSTGLLVGLQELQDRLGFTFTDLQRKRALSLLTRASAKVLSYGNPSWTSTTAPALAREIALDVAERTWNNPRSDLTSQSTGSVSESYVVGSADLTASEINDLRRLGGRRSIGSIRLQPELRTSVLTSRRWGFEDWPC